MKSNVVALIFSIACFVAAILQYYTGKSLNNNQTSMDLFHKGKIAAQITCGVGSFVYFLMGVLL